MSVEAKLGELTQVAKDPATAGTIFSESDNPLVGKIKGEIGGVETEKSKLLKVYKDKHPEIVKIDAQIQHLRDRLEAEFRGTLRSVQTQVKGARAREDSLLSEVNSFGARAELNDRRASTESAARGRVEPAALRLVSTQGRSGRRAREQRPMSRATMPDPIRPQAWNLGMSLVAAGPAFARLRLSTSTRP
jgi:hypothetical protein